MKIASCLLTDSAIAVHPSVSADFILPLPSGEVCKTREVMMQVEDKLLSKGFGKDGTLIAYGGGATLDLAGFVASTYMRGVRLHIVPTTLLAMVDVSIGGKNGINTRHGKNTLGTIYPAHETILLYDVLSTLSERDYLSGIAEILKLGAVYDPSFLSLSFARSEVSYFVPLAREGKSDVVSRDLRDDGYRRILNFGHTIGHALEMRDSLPHGHAVASGMLIEAYYSYLTGALPFADYTFFESVIRRYSFESPKAEPYETLLPYLRVDKKGERVVVLNGLGDVEPFDGTYVSPISHNAMQEAYEYICFSTIGA